MTDERYEAIRNEIVWNAMWNHVIPFSVFVGVVTWLFLMWVQKGRR